MKITVNNIILTLLTAAVLLLCSCAATAGSKNVDYGSVEGYYSELAYEVRTEEGEVTERMYVLFNDEEKTDLAGKKDVYFDALSGDMTSYTVTVGIDEVSELVTYTTGDNDSEYYSEMYFEDGTVLKEVWDNRFTGEDGDEIRMKGEQSYYPGTDQVKDFVEEVYKAGELDQKTEHKYAEDGSEIS